jgi:hypothetical protein
VGATEFCRSVAGLLANYGFEMTGRFSKIVLPIAESVDILPEQLYNGHVEEFYLFL